MLRVSAGAERAVVVHAEAEIEATGHIDHASVFGKARRYERATFLGRQTPQSQLAFLIPPGAQQLSVFRAQKRVIAPTRRLQHLALDASHRCRRVDEFCGLIHPKLTERVETPSEGHATLRHGQRVTGQSAAKHGLDGHALRQPEHVRNREVSTGVAIAFVGHCVGVYGASQQEILRLRHRRRRRHRICAAVTFGRVCRRVRAGLRIVVLLDELLQRFHGAVALELRELPAVQTGILAGNSDDFGLVHFRYENKIDRVPSEFSKSNQQASIIVSLNRDPCLCPLSGAFPGQRSSFNVSRTLRFLAEISASAQIPAPIRLAYSTALLR
eukprot:scaffold2945_cov244-Pinguiococcus_pyrenoidosus.AAC.10